MPKKVNIKDLEAAGRKVAHIIRHTGCMSEVEDGATKKDRHEAMRAEAFGKKVNIKDLEAAGRKVAHIIRHTGCMSEVEDGATKKDRHEAMRAEAFGTGYQSLMYRQMLRSVLECTRSIQNDPNFNPSEVIAHAAQQ